MYVRDEIQAMVERETHAWDTKNVELLVSIFHPDMVWPWPPDSGSHDPVTWIFPQGRYDYKRWSHGWQSLFDSYDLVHNNRETLRIEISKEEDAGFAVVDVDTLWKHKSTGELMLWKGRACKGYTKIGDTWKMIMHTGLLDYS